MRVSLENMRRWWSPRNGNGEAGRNGSGNGHVARTSPDPDHLSPPGHNGQAKKQSPWLGQLDKAGIPRSLRYPSTPLGRLLDQTVDRFGDCDAVDYRNTRWTYRELLDRVNRLAGGLACLGVRKGDRVLMTLPNCPEFITAFFAIQKLGAVPVNAGPLMGQEDLREAVRLARPRVAVCLDLSAAHVMGAIEHQDDIEHFVWTSLATYQTPFRRLGYQFKLWQGGNGRNEPNQNGRHVEMTQLMAHAPARPPTTAPELDQVALLQPTGGTTGSLKLAKLTHRSLLANCTQIVSWMNMRYAQERVLAVLPMFHVYGLTVGLLSSILAGWNMVLMTRFDAEEALSLLREKRISIFPLVPAICDALSDLIEAEEKPAAINQLRLCISGAAPLPQATSQRFTRLTGALVIEGYGLTEASPVTHAGVPGSQKSGIGLPMPDTQVRVINPVSGADVAPGECGEMLISGPQVMSGYLGEPEQTHDALQTDAAGTVWLHTGDIVRYDSDGFFQVVDRKKDMINHAGLKVFPSRVEKVLREHPAVKEVSVVGRADPVCTENVVAVVVPLECPQRAGDLARELRAFCRERLAPYEVPSHVEFVEALPKSALGKVLRKQLRAGAVCDVSQADEVKPDDEIQSPVEVKEIKS